MNLPALMATLALAAMAAGAVLPTRSRAAADLLEVQAMQTGEGSLYTGITLVKGSAPC